MGINVIKCQHATCGQRAFGPVGLVAQVVAGADSLRGNKDAAEQVLQWFEDNFGIKDELPPEAYEGDGESMMVDWHDAEPRAAIEPTAPKVAVVSQLPGTDHRPTIVRSTQQEQIINQAVKALAGDERVYQRGMKLVRALTSEQGEHTIRIIALPTLSEKLSSAANWRTQSEKGKTTPVLPPGWAVKGLYERGQWPGIRVLRGVIDTPVLRPDGTVLFRPGYDPMTGLLLRPAIDFGSIAENPTREDALAALAELLEVVVDFPFETPAHRAAWVAAVLTPFCMYAITGAVPMIAIDGNIRAAGKGLLADTIGIITTGRPLPAQGHVRDDAEIEKRITALALEGGGPRRIDNVRGAFGGAIWEAAVTTRTWLSRILGTTETVKPPLDIMWVVTGNNVEFTGDMPRRTVPIRLASEEERPEDRTGFKHPNLTAWVTRERPRLVRAALTILRAYFAAGRPAQKGVVFGTFEEWASTVASALVWLGNQTSARTDLRWSRARTRTQ